MKTHSFEPFHQYIATLDLQHEVLSYNRVAAHTMNSNSNHFGNPLMVGIVGYRYNPSISPGSTFSKNDDIKQTKQQSLALDEYLQQPRLTTPTTTPTTMRTTKLSSLTSDCSSIPLYVPTGSMSGSHHQQHNPCSPYHHRPRLEKRTASIGLPSQYPGHDRSSSLESSQLEELQDFDEFFGPSFSSESLNTEEECLSSRMSLIEDDDSSMKWGSSSLSQSPKDLLRDSSSRISPPRRNQAVAELSSSRICIPSSPMIDGSPRTSSHHRRSRAMASKEFYNVVLKDLDM
jgi:hypothetical protein